MATTLLRIEWSNFDLGEIRKIFGLREEKR
jgi:hypothetical protein